MKTRYERDTAAILAWMETAGITQHDIVERSGYSASMVSMTISGQRDNAATLLQLERAGCDPKLLGLPDSLLGIVNRDRRDDVRRSRVVIHPQRSKVDAAKSDLVVEPLNWGDASERERGRPKRRRDPSMDAS